MKMFYLDLYFPKNILNLPSYYKLIQDMIWALSFFVLHRLITTHLQPSRKYNTIINTVTIECNFITQNVPSQQNKSIAAQKG